MTDQGWRTGDDGHGGVRVFPDLDPAPDAPVLPPGVRLRTGRKIGRTVYLQAGPEPSSQDRPVGMLDTPALAKLLVRCTNAALDAEARAAAQRQAGQ